MTPDRAPNPPARREVRIAILLTLHDRREFLAAALDSVRASVGAGAVEILVVTNLDEPELARITREHGARYLPTEDRCTGGNLAAGLAASAAEVFVLLDDDDEFEPERLAVVRRAFEEDPELVFFHNSQRFIDARGDPLPSDGYRRPPSVEQSARPPLRLTPARRRRGLVDLVHSEPDFNDSSIAVHRSVLEAALGALPGLRATDSLLFYTALTLEGSILVVPAPLTRYRVHGANGSIRAGGAGAEYLAFLYGSAIRHRGDYQRIAEYLRPRADRTVARTLRGLTAMSDLTVQLRSPTPSRRAMLRTLLGLLRYVNTLPVRSNLRAVGAGLGYLILPGRAQEVYLARVSGQDPFDLDAGAPAVHG